LLLKWCEVVPAKQNLPHVTDQKMYVHT